MDKKKLRCRQMLIQIHTELHCYTKQEHYSKTEMSMLSDNYVTYKMIMNFFKMYASS